MEPILEEKYFFIPFLAVVMIDEFYLADGKQISGLCFQPAFMLFSYLSYSLTMKMEAIRSSKNRVTLNRLHGIVSQKTDLPE
jgi:hypothetical protein